MERYRGYGALDDPPVNDGDNFFNGFRSRVQPSALGRGELAYSQNGRMDRGTWRMRKGSRPKNEGVNIQYEELITGEFSTETPIVISSITDSSGLWVVQTDTPHGFENFQYIDISGIPLGGYNGTAIITVIDSTHFSFYGNGLTAPIISSFGSPVYATPGPVLFDSYPVITSCAFSDPVTYRDGIVIAGLNSAYLYSDGYGMVTINYQFGEVCDSDQSIDLFQYLGNVYLLRGYGERESIAATGGQGISYGDAYIDTGAVPHNLNVGDWACLFEATGGFNGIYRVASVDSYHELVVRVNGYDAADIPDFTAKIRRAKPPLVWDMDFTNTVFKVVPYGNNVLGANYIRMPASDWGLHFKSRAVLALNKDEIVLSDILDPNTYDLSYYQFRMMPGSADWLVTAMPFQEDKVLVLYRNSVHTLLLDSNSLSISQAIEVTRAFGCVARKTAINCGQYMLWLSDIGIIRMNVTDFITIKNDTKPLSDGIQDVIDRVNWAYADRAIAKYWDNRAFVALPLDSSTVNNTVIVYNFLNDAWESVDVYPSTVSISSFETVNFSGKKRMHAVTIEGYVLLLDEVEGMDETGQHIEGGDMVVVDQEAINAYMVTRSYLSGTYDVKNFKRAQIEVSGDNGGVVTAQALLHNPDTQTTQESFTRTAGNADVSLRNSINRRGNAVQMKILTSVASSDIKAVIVEGRVSNRTTIDRE